MQLPNYKSIVISTLLYAALSMTSAFGTGAGILPYAYHKKTNAYYILLGKEANGSVKQTWADFGGGIEPIDNGSSAHNAIREFCEESGYSKRNARKLRHEILKNPVIKHPFRNYFMYFAQIPYRPAGTFIGDGEKSECAWIPFNWLVKELGNTLYQMGTMPHSFVYNGTIYRLRNKFRECLKQFLQDYDPKKQYYYFRSKNPKGIIDRIIG